MYGIGFASQGLGRNVENNDDDGDEDEGRVEKGDGEGEREEIYIVTAKSI